MTLQTGGSHAWLWIQRTIERIDNIQRARGLAITTLEDIERDWKDAVDDTHLLVHRLARASGLAKRELLATVLENQTALFARIANNCRVASRCLGNQELSRVKFAVEIAVDHALDLLCAGESTERCVRYHDAMMRACRRLECLHSRLERYESRSVASRLFASAWSSAHAG